MFRDLTTRHREDEWMDQPGVTPEELTRSLAYIRKINRYLGYTRVTVGYFRRFSLGWNRDASIRVLDLGTGSADVPIAILDWARRAGFGIRIVGLDLHPTTVAIAQREARSGLAIIRGDALRVPFADGSFDYVMTNMFLHHLDEAQVVQVLREMKRVARRGILAADLIRSRRAYAWIWLFTLFARPIIKHDARTSVAQAFTVDELRSLADRAGLEEATVTHHYGHRAVLWDDQATREPAGALKEFDQT